MNNKTQQDKKCMEDYLTPDELAERTGTAASAWRNAAAAGRIPGAIKRAGVWFIPADASGLIKPRPRNKDDGLED